MLKSDRVFIRRYSEKSRIYKHALDSFSIACGFWLAVTLCNLVWEDNFLWAIIMSYAIFMLIAEYNEIYVCGNQSKSTKKIIFVICTWVSVVLFLFLINYIFLVFTYLSIRLLFFWCVASSLFFSTWRFVFYKYLDGFRFDNRRVVIAGGTPLATRLANTIMEQNWRGEQLLGVYDDRSYKDHRAIIPKHVKSLGNFDEMIADARNKKFDVVYLVLPLKAQNRMFEQTEKLADTSVSVYVAPDFSPFKLLNPIMTAVNGIPLISIFEAPFLQYYSFEDFIKRIVDIVLSLCLILICFIPMIFIAIGIKLTSKGPVIFCQNRYGIDGKKMVIYKFRSLSVCETGEESVQVVKNDPRITLIGRYIRKYSLDELPQLLNVIVGNMSLVGPRPHSVAINERYRSKIHGYMLRHKMKPGLTGWAQVCGFRGETNTLDKMQNRIRCDYEYMENWTLTLDFKILLMTIARRAWIV